MLKHFQGNMQEEPHFVSRPHFSGVYDEGWNHGAPPISFGTHEEKIFEGKMKMIAPVLPLTLSSEGMLLNYLVCM